MVIVPAIVNNHFFSQVAATAVFRMNLYRMVRIVCHSMACESTNTMISVDMTVSTVLCDVTTAVMESIWVGCMTMPKPPPTSEVLCTVCTIVRFIVTVFGTEVHIVVASQGLC